MWIRKMERFLFRLPKKRRNVPEIGRNGENGEDCDAKKIQKSNTSGQSGGNQSQQPKQSYLEFGSHKHLGRLMTCVSCGMSYVEDNEEDCRRHDKHCKISKELKLRSIRVGDILDQDEEKDVTIVQISIEEILSNKKSFQIYYKAINRMYDELGGCIDELEDRNSDSYVLFYVKHLNILAIVVVELISRSALMLSGDADEDSHKESNEAHLCVSNTCALCPVTTLGIRQMWVRSNYRGMGINFTLLEIARKKTFPRLLLSRHHVAFSQPTEEGKRFISRYFQSRAYWIYSHR